VPLSEIIPLLERDDWIVALQEAVDHLPLSRVLAVDDLPVAARAAVIATLISRVQRPTVIVTSRLDTAEEMAGLLSEYLDVDPLVWPVADALPYEQLPVDRTVSARRVETLLRLLDDQASVIIAPARALTQIVNPPEQMAGERLELVVGQRLRVDAFVASALEQGYEFTPMVMEPGQISRRGGIVDVFPPASEHAVRFDLFGD
jgi:transcription-repair coupling factor (superfamily II helicase)